MTPTELANMALDLLGTPPIDLITSTSSSVAIACNRNYALARQEYLRDANPSFARKEVALALSSGETSVKWTYVYGVPSSYLELREIYNSSGNDVDRIEYVVGSHSSLSSNVILSNEETPTIFYTIDIENLNLFSSHDIRALSFLLASKLAMPIKRDVQAMDMMYNYYRTALAVAMTHDNRQQFKKLPDFNEYNNARG